MTFGSTIAGGGVNEPSVHDLRIAPSIAGARLDWDLVGGPVDWDGSLWIGLDGFPQGQAEPDAEEYQLPPAEAGTHRVEVRPVPASSLIPPDLHGDPHGRRPYLRWNPATANDVREYRIRDGIGDLVGTVDGVVLHERWAMQASTGTGAGRVNVLGSWQGDATNQAFNVLISAAGASSDLPDAGAAEAFDRGDLVALGSGVMVEFIDPRAAYDNDDEFKFWVGPPVEWRGDEDLDAGQHAFRVEAVDEAGNIGAHEEAAFACVPAPLPPSVTIASDGESFDAVIDEDVDELRLYLNWSPVFQAKTGLLNRDQAFESFSGPITAGTFSDSMPMLPDGGEWRLGLSVVRDGVESFVAIQEFDADQPEGPPALATPSIISIVPLPAGEARIVWAYGGLDAGALVKFRIQAQLDPNIAPAAPINRELVATPPADGSSATFQIDFDEDLENQHFITVFAVDGDGNEVASEAVAFVGDATPPGKVSGLEGTPD